MTIVCSVYVVGFVVAFLFFITEGDLWRGGYKLSWDNVLFPAMMGVLWPIVVACCTVAYIWELLRGESNE